MWGTRQKSSLFPYKRTAFLLGTPNFFGPSYFDLALEHRRNMSNGIPGSEGQTNFKVCICVQDNLIFIVITLFPHIVSAETILFESGNCSKVK